MNISDKRVNDTNDFTVSVRLKFTGGFAKQLLLFDSGPYRGVLIILRVMLAHLDDLLPEILTTYVSTPLTPLTSSQNHT